MNFKPMLAAKIDEEAQLQKLSYPLIGMPKYDGIRCIIKDNLALSRTLKLIPNDYIRRTLRADREGKSDIWDGELIIPGKNYNEVQSAVMSREGEPKDFRYMVFDRVEGSNYRQPYYLRLQHNVPIVANATSTPYEYLHNVDDVLAFETNCINKGFEGIILRDPNGPYKFGRSTLKQQWLLKFKRVEDAEAEILECIELMHNDNLLQQDERGYAKRSSHQENKAHSGMLGSFKVRGINGRYKDKVFNVSCGSMTQDMRRELWRDHLNDNRTFYKAAITYKYAKHRGTSDAPAEPVFVGVRKDL